MGWGLERLLPRYVRRRRVYCECRRCGTTIENATKECPCCETESVVEYELR